jgi:Tfp pilus assembly protein PilN
VINLLPPKLKNEYQTYLNHRFMIFFGSSATFVLLVFIILLGATFAFLEIQTIALEQQIEVLEASEQNRRFSELHESLSELIQQYRSADMLDDKILPTHPVLEEVVSLVPAGIYLNNLNFNRERKEILISGFAPQREQVIEFEAGFNDSEIFEKVVSPLANLIKETDITFNFTIILR